MLSKYILNEKYKLSYTSCIKSFSSENTFQVSKINFKTKNPSINLYTQLAIILLYNCSIQ